MDNEKSESGLDAIEDTFTYTLVTAMVEAVEDTVNNIQTTGEDTN